MAERSSSDLPNIIRNPSNSNHYMRVKPVSRRITVKMKDQVLAQSDRALRILETGRDIYDPVIYLPKEDLKAPLQTADAASTHCPLKGDATYWSFDEGSEWIAWSYEAPFDFAGEIAGYVSFDASKVTLIESGET